MIRPATHADIHKMLALGEAMHAESRYAAIPWDASKVGSLIGLLIESPDGLALVSDQSGEVTGGFMGSVSEHYFSQAKVASDFALFVSQDKRGGLSAAMMLRTFKAWACERGASMIQVGVTTGANVEQTSRLFKACGFHPVGNLFEFSP